MTCGIYLGSPKSLLTDKVYIGMSINIEERVRRHNSDMRAGLHRKKMQAAYIEYGPFEWEILCECNESDLIDKEAEFIKLFDSCNNGFNTYIDANYAPILYGLDNGRVSEEYLQLCLSIVDVSLANPTWTRYKVADFLNTEEYVVSHLWYAQSSTWLKDIIPEKYQEMVNLRGTRQIGGKTAKQQGISYPIIISPDLTHNEIDNVRSFAKLHGLDKGDLSNVLNMKVASVKGWIIKDLDIINPEAHNRFYSSNRGHYKRQFDLYKK